MISGNRLLSGILAFGIVAAGSARAQSVEEFYRGKTITMYVGTGENSGIVGAYPHTIAQIIKKYIPGRPNVIVTHMPGAGGIKLANFIQNVGSQDGLHWAFITRGFMLAPLLRIPGAQFDPTKFNWIGSPARTVSIGAVWTANTKVRTIHEAMQQEVVLGATAPNQDTAIFPKALNRIAGTKFRIVTGYSSVGEVDLAMQKGELQGKVGFTWSSLTSGSSANWLRDGVVKVIVQLGLEKSADVPAEVPLALDLAQSIEDRQVLEILCAPSATGFPSFMGAGVPNERIEAIREAYRQTMRDPEFIEATKKQVMDVDPIEATEIERIVKTMYSSSPAAVARARDIVGTN
jgi:tripartite-type tricarboxylate transporter receptor subunit TctC